MREVIKEKDKIVQEIREKVSRSQIGILTDFKGLEGGGHDPAAAPAAGGLGGAQGGEEHPAAPGRGG